MAIQATPPLLRMHTPDYRRLVLAAGRHPRWADLPTAKLRRLLRSATLYYLRADWRGRAARKDTYRGDCLYLRYLLGVLRIEGGRLPDYSDPDSYFH